jgi:hypothetical protein
VRTLELPADPGREQYVGRPEAAGEQRQRDAEPVEVGGPEVRQQDDPAAGHGHPEQIERTPRPRDRHAERADELECHGDAERDPVDRLVEAQVHRDEREPVCQGQPPLGARQTPHRRAPQRREDDGREQHAEEGRAARADLVEQGLREGPAELDRRHRGQHEQRRRYTVGPDHGGAPY